MSPEVNARHCPKFPTQRTFIIMKDPWISLDGKTMTHILDFSQGLIKAHVFVCVGARVFACMYVNNMNI